MPAVRAAVCVPQEASRKVGTGQAHELPKWGPGTHLTICCFCCSCVTTVTRHKFRGRAGRGGRAMGVGAFKATTSPAVWAQNSFAMPCDAWRWHCFVMRGAAIASRRLSLHGACVSPERACFLHMALDM